MALHHTAVCWSAAVCDCGITHQLFLYRNTPPPWRPYFGHIHVRINRATLVKGDSKTICTNLGQSKLHDKTCFAECEQQTPYILYESVDADCIYFVMREDYIISIAE